ncbi:hypothetical protein EDF58_11015 [Novosphingobium sp. PhB57]|uniref:hypothetical protein n=1 Tax=Novosphingobium sp. PhB57 TaxID=2485107 RepID=UPI00104736E1|nr:hypothetical protein [Novosphingobium sp. PhB57]TCU53765.1 hypothetical protein EDF58_11015 [Novosphingobium sp. PhB57]
MSDTHEKLAANMPAPNPWLTPSVYPTSHFNPGATDSVAIAGPIQGKTLVKGDDAKFVRNFMASNPTLKKIGSDTVAFASGMFGLRKLFLTGKAIESISYMAYPGFEEVFEGADEATVEGLLAEWDKARREGDDADLMEAIRGVDDIGFTHAIGMASTTCSTGTASTIAYLAAREC